MSAAGAYGIRKDSAFLVGWLGGCISPALHATNRWDSIEGVGEVQDSVLSPASLAPDRRVAKGARIASVSLARPPSLLRVGRRCLRPRLENTGPRSLTCVRVIGLSKPKAQ